MAAKNESKNESSDLRTLPPEDRIKRLKQIEEEKRKEIQEAEKLIKESENELTDRRKWVERVPIPQFAQEDTRELSEEAKQILTQRGISKAQPPQEQEPEKKESTLARSTKPSLEEAVAREAPSFQKTAPGVQYQMPLDPLARGFNPEYIAAQSQVPLQEMRREMESLYQNVGERGYMTLEEQRRANIVYSAIDEKLKAAEAGSYSMNEEIAQAATLTKRLTGRLLDNAYQANKSGAGGGPTYWT